MARSETSFDGFLRERFLDLPWLVLQDVCLYLSADFVYKVLIRVPKAQDFVAWYSQYQEVHLLPCGEEYEHHRCGFHPHPRKFDVTNYNNIQKFFASYPHFVPKSYSVFIPRDFPAAKKMFQTFHDRISKASQLHVGIAYCEISPEDIEMLFTFQNLCTFELHLVKLDPCIRIMSRLFPLSRSLRKIRIQLERDPLTFEMELPPFLESLNVYVGPGWRSRAGQRGEIVTELFSSPGEPKSAFFPSLMDLESLRTLEINSMWEIVNISLLPPKLEHLRLLHDTNTIEYDEMPPRWPQNLKSLTIRSYSCETSIWKQLLDIEWPPLLSTLSLEDPRISSLDGLNLPNYLKHFELEGNMLESLQDTHNLDNYRFFRFPNSLKTLSLSKCDYINWEGERWGQRIEVRDRIMFPDSLETLNLSKCRLEGLACFVFPLSLKTLILEENYISNLNTYNLYAGKSKLVHWSQLTNLKKIFLRENKLRNLNHWCPPESLIELDLSNNKIKRLLPKVTPLFQIKYRETTNQIQRLNLRGNKIEEIGSTLHLPENLLALDLSSNKLTEFQFFDSLASHEMLNHLKLELNSIRRIRYCGPGFPHQSKLKRLNFDQDLDNCDDSDEEMFFTASSSKDKYFEMTAEEFHSALRSIGLISTRAKPILRSHIFK